MGLLHEIRISQEVLAALSSPDSSKEPERKSLEKFLGQLSNLWKDGEVWATHRSQSTKERTWRTKKDPFEDIWPEVLVMLQKNPDSTAKSIFKTLQKQTEGRYKEGQLRTMQRRVKSWRHIMAQELVYGCIPDPMKNDLNLKPNGTEKC